jgi:uncharacterized protein (TIGR03435 family)
MPKHSIHIVLAAGLMIAPSGHAQTFEVASIKPNRTGARNSGFRRAGPGELNATNVTLKMLIAYAYDIRDYQISGGPNWLDSDRYDILAKPEITAETVAEKPADRNALLRLRVRSLLSDRFQLTLHPSTKELPRFALIVGKNGPKLNASTSSASELVTNGHHLTCQKVTIDAFAKVFLQGQLGRSVVNKTGIPGEFDFIMDWAPDQPDGESGNSEGPSFFTALQEQLGLKLEPDKGPVEILVIDRAERASEN